MIHQCLLSFVNSYIIHFNTCYWNFWFVLAITNCKNTIFSTATFSTAGTNLFSFFCLCMNVPHICGFFCLGTFNLAWDNSGCDLVRHILAKWFGFPHFLQVFHFAGHGLSVCGQAKPHWWHTLELFELCTKVDCCLNLCCLLCSSWSVSVEVTTCSMPSAWFSLSSSTRAPASLNAYLRKCFDLQCWITVDLIFVKVAKLTNNQQLVCVGE